MLRDVALLVKAGGVAALFGANGAGKTTSLRVAGGLLRPTRGSVMVAGVDVTRKRASERAKSGVCLIPEGRGVFRGLTVRENLELYVPPWLSKRADIDPAIMAFPILGKRLGQVAGSLSGGEQQMLAVGRAYLSAPKVVLVDELSMGLSPIIVDQIYQSLRDLNSLGVGLLIVEQYIKRALAMADLAYLMVRGRIVWSGAPRELDQNRIAASYLGEVDELVDGQVGNNGSVG